MNYSPTRAYSGRAEIECFPTRLRGAECGHPLNVIYPSKQNTDIPTLKFVEIKMSVHKMTVRIGDDGGMFEKIPLNERQHAEVLIFAEQSLQDIRDAKSIQLQTVIFTVSLFAGVFGILNALEWQLLEIVNKFYYWGFAILVIFLASTALLWQKQRWIIEVRWRMRSIYNEHFTVNWKPITKKKWLFNNRKQFRILGDNIIPYVSVTFLSALLFAMAIYTKMHTC